MELRAEAQSCQAFMALKDVYDNRSKKALEWKAAGGKVVATLGCDVPDEILIAGGFLPIRVYGEKDIDLSVANTYLENAFDPMIRAQFERITDGSHANLADHLVISKSTDALIRVFYYLREIRKLEAGVAVPPLYFVEWFFVNHNMLSQTKNWDRIQSFRETAEAWAGREITDEEIWAACRLCDEDRALLREFSALRWGETPTVTGSELLIACGASLFMDKREHIALMREVLEQAKTWKPVSGKRIYISGSDQEDTDLYTWIEQCGGHVVSEDHNWGERHFEGSVNEEIFTPVRAIVDRYTSRTPSSKRSQIAPRVKAFTENVKRAGAEAVVIYLHKYEDSPSWDIPSQVNAMAELGIPVLTIDKQEYSSELAPETKAKIKAFIGGR